MRCLGNSLQVLGFASNVDFANPNPDQASLRRHNAKLCPQLSNFRRVHGRCIARYLCAGQINELRWRWLASIPRETVAAASISNRIRKPSVGRGPTHHVVTASILHDVHAASRTLFGDVLHQQQRRHVAAGVGSGRWTPVRSRVVACNNLVTPHAYSGSTGAPVGANDNLGRVQCQLRLGLHQQVAASRGRTWEKQGPLLPLLQPCDPNSQRVVDDPTAL